ncbi:MAG TPA: inorganic diphosphatase [Thermoanaerobaculia bacterium]|jgi:inorganic pyrophosphatase|nr:inorganic diphosphatase [Thermoanaerobaculia bacterium]
MARRNAKTAQRSAADLAAWDDDSGNLRVVVDTPRGSAVKYKLDVEKGVYKVSHMLAAGLAFPYDFGSIPGTLAEDGDPLDALVIAEAGTFVGCLLEVRLIGGLVARQTQKGRTMRNDRLIGVAAESRAYARVRAMRQLPKRLLDDLERFFVTYNEARGRRFRVDRRVGGTAARRLVAEGEERFARRAKR